MNSDMDRADHVGVTDGDMIASVKNGNAVALVQNV